MEFDDNSRRRVIRELQRRRGVELGKIGAARNYLADDRGVRYVVLGGVDYRHEIPRSIFEAEERDSGDTLLVVATLDAGNLEIFLGPFQPLLEHRNRLAVNRDQYVFHLHRFTTRLIVREVPSLELMQITRQTPEDRTRAARKTLENLKRAQSIAVARARQSNSAEPDATRRRRSVVAVEGNIIRADFRKRGSK